MKFACRLSVLALLLPATAAAPVDVLTQRGDNARTSLYLEERDLSPSTVSSGHFGKLYFREVDGNPYAQPLYVSGINIRGKARNVIYVATEANSVYAFEDDSTAQTPLWQVSLGAPIPSKTLSQDLVGNEGCVDLTTQIGITSTPVIDRGGNTVYAVAKTRTVKRGKPIYTYTIHALDIRNGNKLRKAVIAGNVLGPGIGSQGGKITFDPKSHLNRPGLLLNNGVVYVAFGAHCDVGVFHGWLFAYDASTLARKAVLNTTPNTTGLGNGQGGIWQSGHGLAADGEGNLYIMVGNGSYTGDGGDLGDAFVKLKLDGHTFKKVGWYAPSNQEDLRKQDVDLGSSGPLLIPGTNLLVGAGKEGKLHLLDRTAMVGKVAQAVQEVQATLMPVPLKSMPSKAGDVMYWNVHGAPVYYEGPSDRLLYICGEEEPIKAFRLEPAAGPTDFRINPLEAFARSDERAAFAPVRSPYPPDTGSAASKGARVWMPGGFLALSAHGMRSDTAVLWALMPLDGNANQRVVQGVLRAFDATQFDTRPDGSRRIRQIWSSDAVGNDNLGMYPKFVTPIVANGRVIVSAFNEEDGNHQVGGPRKAALVVYGRK